MSLESYMDSLDLMTPDTIEKVLPQLHAYARYENLTAADLDRSEKLPFGFNYVDHSLDIVHDNDQQGEHSSHVAGIAAANRYIPTYGGYADARDQVRMLGVAPDAQIITMKVFGKGNPFDSDYMVAIEDAIMLGCGERRHQRHRRRYLWDQQPLQPCPRCHLYVPCTCIISHKPTQARLSAGLYFFI